MSSNDLTNPQVLKNHLLSQMKEGKGKFYYKQNVVVFRDKTGSEFIAPKEIAEEKLAKIEKEKEEKKNLKKDSKVKSK